MNSGIPAKMIYANLGKMPYSSSRKLNFLQPTVYSYKVTSGNEQSITICYLLNQPTMSSRYNEVTLSDNSTNSTIVLNY